MLRSLSGTDDPNDTARHALREYEEDRPAELRRANQDQPVGMLALLERQELRGRRRLSFVPTRAEITRHHEPIPGEDPWVRGPPKPEHIEVVEYDPRWPARFESVTRAIRAVLGDAALSVEHVGSTSVAGLAAKPVLDIDITVSDPADEATYVPALQRAGFTLVIREPRWHQHRCLRLAHPRCNLHVFGADCPELVRHRMFREWLIAHPEDRELYCRAKLAAARVTTDRGGIVMDYNRYKEPVIREIYERMFRAHGLLP